MIIEFALVKVAAARTHILDGRLVAHIIVNLLQAAILPVLDDLLRAAFRLAQENAIDMVDHFFSVKHGGNATSKHSLATLVVFFGDSPTAFHLRGEHHRQCHEVAFLVKVDGFHVFVGKRNVYIFR